MGGLAGLISDFFNSIGQKRRPGQPRHVSFGRLRTLGRASIRWSSRPTLLSRYRKGAKQWHFTKCGTLPAFQPKLQGCLAASAARMLSADRAAKQYNETVYVPVQSYRAPESKGPVACAKTCPDRASPRIAP